MSMMRMMMKTTRILEIGYNLQVVNVVSVKVNFLKIVSNLVKESWKSWRHLHVFGNLRYWVIGGT